MPPRFPDPCPSSRSLLTSAVPCSRPILVSSMDRQTVEGTSRVPSSKSHRRPVHEPSIRCVPASRLSRPPWLRLLHHRGLKGLRRGPSAESQFGASGAYGFPSHPWKSPWVCASCPGSARGGVGVLSPPPNT